MKSRKFKSFLFLVVMLTAVTFSCDDSMPEPIYGSKPTVAFTATQSPGDIFTWSFTNNSSGAVSYSWNFGDGNGSSDANPSHTYSGAGSFTVTLTATAAGTSNALGWRGTASQSVQIDLPTYERADVTFSVDMKNAGLAEGDRVNLNGSFQDNDYDGTPENPDLANWCGECGWNEMKDDDGDGVYELTINLATNITYQYKYVINNWARDEKFGADDACAITTDNNNYNRPAVIGNMDQSVEMTTACYDSCEDCIDYAAALVGSWSPIGMGVGEAKGNEGWWSYPRDGSRGCWEDDKFEFKADGTLTIDLGSDTWLEPWQGKDPEGCGAPVAPHVNGDYSYTLDVGAMTLKLDGAGAYLGLAKAVNGGEISGGAAQPDDRTYEVVSISDTELVVDMNIGHGYWRFYLAKN